MATPATCHHHVPLGTDPHSSRRHIRWVGACVSLTLMVFTVGRMPAPALAQHSQFVAGTAAQADQAVVVDVSELARSEAANAKPAARRFVHHPLRGPEAGGPGGEVNEQPPAPPGKPSHATHQPEASFTGTGDNGTIIPPDTMGAVGPNNVVESLNNNFQIFNRSGALISSVTQTGFWSKVSVSEVFDPRITYDPYNGRWIVAAGANQESTSSAILVGSRRPAIPLARGISTK
jgi:hypothetical protein